MNFFDSDHFDKFFRKDFNFFLYLSSFSEASMELNEAMQSEYEHQATIMIGMIIRSKPIMGIVQKNKYDIQKCT